MKALERVDVLPEPGLPSTAELVAEGRALARRVKVGRSAFLDHYAVSSEAQYKRQRAASGEVMLHAQIGYRDFDRTVAAVGEVWERLDRAGYRLDRFGVQFDQVMGYPAAARKGRISGAGMVVDDVSRLSELTAAAPVACHFGDFVVGFPSAVENASAALAAGATTIGNLGQYWCYRLFDWDDDVAVTAETVRALAMLAAQPVDIIVHSNINDGMAALFCDLSCALGGILLEKHIVEDLLGARVGHCFGHTFSEPLTRIAFQRAVATVGGGPGSMIYGNTTGYRAVEVQNFATLGTYLLVDVLGQRTRPTGHAINPVPVTEAERIPDVDEIVDAHLFANRLIERALPFEQVFDFDAVDRTAAELVAGGERFRDAVLAGLGEAGVDTGDAVEMLLALRRIGAKRLEQWYGPGAADATRLRGRRPVVQAPVITEIEASGARCLAGVDDQVKAAVRARGLTGCVASTDVHEYGKIMVERVLGELGVQLLDAGTDVSPQHLAAIAREGGADFIALGTYNGLALGYVSRLREALREAGLLIPVYVGGRINEVPEGSNTSLPVDVSGRVRKLGVHTCERVEDMLLALASPTPQALERSA